MSQIIKVAIADDHPLIIKGSKEIFETFDEIEFLFSASNGRELVDELEGRSKEEKELPDVIILDIEMPIMNGFETGECLQQEFPNIKFIAVSILEDELSIIRMMKIGAKGYLFKNAEPDEIRRAINEVHERGFYFTQEVANALTNSHVKPQANNDLSERELAFVHCAATELTYKEIAPKMKVSESNLDNIRASVFKKFSVRSRVGLVTYAIKIGIVDLENPQDCCEN